VQPVQLKKTGLLSSIYTVCNLPI